MSKRIEDPAETPAVRLLNRDNLGGTSPHSPFTHRIRVIHHHQHPHRTATERVRAEVQIRRRLIRNPELRTLHNQLRNNRTIRCINAMEHHSPECSLIKGDSRPTIPHR
jgi:hypothetical protein